MQSLAIDPRPHLPGFLRWSNQLIAGLTLATSLTLLSSLHWVAQGAEPAPVLQAAKPAAISTLPDGTYLYGQAPKPDRLGQGYFVFQVTQGTVVGALYMPRSSFDCASGRFQESELALTVVNSYDRMTNPYSIALDRTSTVASNSKNPALRPVQLEGFYPIQAVSQNDLRMLSLCKAELKSGLSR